MIYLYLLDNSSDSLFLVLMNFNGIPAYIDQSCNLYFAVYKDLLPRIVPTGITDPGNNILSHPNVANFSNIMSPSINFTSSEL